jgi:hypothetical protein
MPSGCRTSMQLSPRFLSFLIHPELLPFHCRQLFHSLLYLYMFLTCFNVCVQQFSSSPEERSTVDSFNTSLATLVTSGIQAVLWPVGLLDLYLNFYFMMKYTWIFYLPVIHAFSAGVNLKCSMCVSSRCSEQAWCRIFQVGVCVVRHSIGEMDSVIWTEWPAQRLLTCEWVAC